VPPSGYDEVVDTRGGGSVRRPADYMGQSSVKTQMDNLFIQQGGAQSGRALYPVGAHSSDLPGTVLC